jgi:uncharacterized protein
MIKTYIPRKNYLQRIKPFIKKDIIKVIIGQRRVGKSYMLFQIIDEIKKDNKNANIIFINKELDKFADIKNHKDLLCYIKKNSKKTKNFVFIDEIQDIENFEKALRDLNAQGNYDIYCTGSNANLLSSELATYLSGRYIEFEIFSLSYSEFLQFHDLSESQDSFLKYLKYGGLPYLKNLELTDEVVFEHLKSIYNTILFKDIIARHNIRNFNFLENLVEYLADNTGSLVSSKRISDFLKSQKINISTNLVLDYLSYLSQAFFIFKVFQHDTQGKKIFEINQKYYFEDLGLRHSIINYQQADLGKILENLVFLHLRILGYKIYIGKLGNKEIDFIAKKNNKRIYFQVAYMITAQSKKREFENLLEIKDNYPKFVISMDELIDNSEYKGIQHLNIRKFLLSEDF